MSPPSTVNAHTYLGKHLHRGIDPQLLISQVQNTMPYLFETSAPSPWDAFIPAQMVRNAHAEHQQEEAPVLSHFDYFKLCLSAHYLTCATPVPTDVDNQIRRKLWPEQLPLEVAMAMTQWVLESRHWDFTLVSSRHIHQLGGHQGEWFTVAAASYCALKQYPASQAPGEDEIQRLRVQIHDAIGAEVQRHSDVFGALYNANDGIGCLKASASLAHNFGDLDRVMDLWDLGMEDPLRQQFYKLSASPVDLNGNLRYLGRLWIAGELYKAPIQGSSMAQENHRHFALRKPKVLRKSATLLVPNGPFLDDWGRALGRYLDQASASTPEETTQDREEVLTALKHGQQRLPHTFAYLRAMVGLLGITPQTQADFESEWNRQALEHLDEIPSRAKL